MSLSYGFYNSVNDDRLYNAEDISSIFDGIINDGVYMSIGGKLLVKTNSGMTLKISSGRAWFDHTWSFNDSDVNVTLDSSDPLLNRIDAIILEVNHSTDVRANSFKVIKGTAATNPSRPTLINTNTVKQYPLAYILVNAGTTEISQANITNMVGTSSTPYVTGIIDRVSIDDLVAQWATEFNEWMSDNETEYQTWKDEYIQEMTIFKATAQYDFETWFDAMKDQLSEDAAGNLQNQINNINTIINTKADISDINNLQDQIDAFPNKASASQATSGTDDNTYMTPAKVNSFYANKKANNTETMTGTDDSKYVTPAKLSYYFVNKKQFTVHTPALSEPSNSGSTISLSNYIDSATKKLEFSYYCGGSSNRYSHAVTLSGTDIIGNVIGMASDNDISHNSISNASSAILSAVSRKFFNF